MQSGIPAGATDPFTGYSPYYVGTKAGSPFAPSLYRVGGRMNYAGRPMERAAASPETAAQVIFNEPFGSLFASIFRKGSESAGTLAQASGDESRNPFREAKQRQESTPSIAEPTTPAGVNSPPSVADTKPETPSAHIEGNASTPPAEPRFIFLGDFDGAGALRVERADRLDERTFTFPDAQRTFNLFINPSAVEFERSFAIDDLNNDGLVDLLVASRAGLFGGVLLGEADGNFRLADAFLTAYEPTVVTLGQVHNGMHDIVALNCRTGVVTTFRADDRYRPLHTQSLGFAPDYVAHLASQDDGRDYLMAARAGDQEFVYRWYDDGRLEDSGQNLPGDPSVSFGADPLLQNVVSSLLVYQIGSEASITLSNGRGQSFNVANMRVRPNVFLAIGDLSNRGTLDVAFAFAIAKVPVK